MDLEAFASRVAARPIPLKEARDALVLWFVERATPQIEAGMRFTDPDASIAEIRRVARLRARSFFSALASTFDQPTAADLRRVKERMERWLRPDRRDAGEAALWDRILSLH